MFLFQNNFTITDTRSIWPFLISAAGCFLQRFFWRNGWIRILQKSDRLIWNTFFYNRFAGRRNLIFPKRISLQWRIMTVLTFINNLYHMTWMVTTFNLLSTTVWMSTPVIASRTCRTLYLLLTILPPVISIRCWWPCNRNSR